MATVTPGITFVSGETVTPAKLNSAATPTVVVADGEITTAKIVDANVTDAKLATGIDASKLTTGTLPIARIADGAVVSSKLADGAVVSSKLADGAVVQVVQSSAESLQTITTTLPCDDSIPQSSEGAEVITATITPSSATNKVLIHANIQGTASGNVLIGIALFKDSDASAIAAVANIGFNYSLNTSLQYMHSPSTTSSVTYKIRAGANSGNFYVNGNQSGNRLFGGASRTTLTLTEIKAS